MIGLRFFVARESGAYWHEVRYVIQGGYNFLILSNVISAIRILGYQLWARWR